MRWWIIVGCVFFGSCGDEPVEKSVTPTGSDNGAGNHTSKALDTSSSFAKDTTSHASFTVPEIKKPSGIYQFELPYEGKGRITHTIAFYPNSFHLEEEYSNTKDSVVVTEGTWTPSQGFIWLYKEQLVRGRYVWKGDTLQYFNPRLNKKFSMTKLTPASANPVWQTLKKQGAVLYGVGTEPFWSVEVKKQDSIILSMPDWTEPLRVKFSSTKRENKNTVYTAATDSLQVTVLPYFCSDGMSDFTYSSKILISYKGRRFEGCGVVF